MEKILKIIGGIFSALIALLLGYLSFLLFRISSQIGDLEMKQQTIGAAFAPLIPLILFAASFKFVKFSVGLRILSFVSVLPVLYFMLTLIILSGVS